MSIIHIDVESVPPDLTSDEIDALVRSKIPGNLSRPETIAKWIEQNRDRIYRRLSLDVMRARVLCIGFAIGDEPPRCIWESTERETLERLWRNLDGSDRSSTCICSHNGAGFDWPLLRNRAAHYGLWGLSARFMQRSRYSPIGLVDTCLAWSAPESRPVKGSSLESLASFLNIPP